MIAFLDGDVISYDSAGRLELAVGGVAFELAVVPGYDAWSAGDSVRVYTHMSVTPDKISLYGFPERSLRDLFRVLTTVTGVGPKIALNILALGTALIARSIQGGTPRNLTAASGVGPKMAERIVLELRDKVGEFAAAAGVEAERGDSGEAADGPARTAVDALTQLGFTRNQAQKAVARATSGEGAGLDAASLIKSALRLIREP